LEEVSFFVDKSFVDDISGFFKKTSDIFVVLDDTGEDFSFLNSLVDILLSKDISFAQFTLFGLLFSNSSSKSWAIHVDESLEFDLVGLGT